MLSSNHEVESASAADDAALPDDNHATVALVKVRSSVVVKELTTTPLPTKLNEADTPAAPIQTQQFQHVSVQAAPTNAELSSSQAKVGESRFGFSLVSELGRGAFGQVFLARQTALADRLVVLKVGSELADETERLSQLQHPNIVPIYSFHREGKHQAFCMPYLGAVTLNHLLARVRTTDISTLNGRILSTVLSEVQTSQTPDIPTTSITGESFQVSSDEAPVEMSQADKQEAVAVQAASPFLSKSYNDSVLWIASRIASALSAAHKADIIHSDLKPANILLSRDGEPQLIDFGVSFDAKARLNLVKIGGTRPYMSPEQLRSVQAQQLAIDQRSDLFGLGVILYELFTGHRPYKEAYEKYPPLIDHELSVREVVPSVRALNEHVSWGIEAIVQKCLAFDPDDRYQSADDFQEDVQLQLQHRPLKYAKNLSSFELVGKFTRRNRVLLTCGSILLVGSAAVAAFASHNQMQATKLDSFQTIAAERAFTRSALQLLAELESAGPNDEALQLSLNRADQLLAETKTSPETSELRGSLLLTMARVTAKSARNQPDDEAKLLMLARAEALNKQAEGVLEDISPSAAAMQSVWIARQSQQTTLLQELNVNPAQTALDHRTEGCINMDMGLLSKAKASFHAALVSNPQDYWATFHLASTLYRSSPVEWPTALELYNRCIALDPDMPGAIFNRGLLLLKMKNFKKAEADFSTIIALRDTWAEPYLNRSTAREGLLNDRGALEDLTKALELGASATPVLMARSRIQNRLGDKAAATKDYKAALETEPTDERGWVSRGTLLLPKPDDRKPASYVKALQCFENALELNPRSLTALQFKARVYSLTDQNEKAIAALTEQLSWYPESVDALSGRAMLYSRLGERAKAHQDADLAEALCQGAPATMYQLAGVYAMTSKIDADDKVEAYRLLAYALRNGYGMNLLQQDRELDYLRSEDEFSKVVEDAQRFIERRKKN